MRINRETCLVGDRCVLVPYRPEHVETYHKWMSDPWLRETTASEPLTLEEEIEMQRDWESDERKCTFIVTVLDDDARRALEEHGREHVLGPEFVRDGLARMAGDVNLFLRERDDDDDDARGSLEAELDVMIAAPEHRRRGLGTEAVRLAMVYGVETLDVTRFFVKIHDSNNSSKRLFRGTLGYRECGRAECFRETEFEWTLPKGGPPTTKETTTSLRRALLGSDTATMTERRCRRDES